MAKTIKVAGEGHTIKKNKKGEVIVDHAGNKGKYDKINLTKKAGAKTINKLIDEAVIYYLHNVDDKKDQSLRENISMSAEDKAKSPARVIDFSAVKKAKEDAMDEPMGAPSSMHPAARALAKKEAEKNK